MHQGDNTTELDEPLFDSENQSGFPAVAWDCGNSKRLWQWLLLKITKWPSWGALRSNIPVILFFIQSKPHFLWDIVLSPTKMMLKMQDKTAFQITAWTRMDCYWKLCPPCCISNRSPGRPWAEQTPVNIAHLESCEGRTAPRRLSACGHSACCTTLMGTTKICICKLDLKKQNENKGHIWKSLILNSSV